MTGLKELTDGILGIVTADKLVFREFEHLPASKRPRIFAAVGISGVTLEKSLIRSSVKMFDTAVTLRARVLALPDCLPGELYAFVDSKIVDPLAKSGYYIQKITIGAPAQSAEHGRMVLQSEIVLTGKTEVV